MALFLVIVHLWDIKQLGKTSSNYLELLKSHSFKMRFEQPLQRILGACEEVQGQGIYFRFVMFLFLL